VVGVSWYEANAYAAWLAGLLEQLRAGRSDLPPEDIGLVRDLPAGGGAAVRLPTETEWARLAGGAAVKERYPWDPPAGPATAEQAAILARANTKEAGLQGTSPVGMYPLGASQPFGLLELAGNVWEWVGDGSVQKGGSWFFEADLARCGGRFRNNPRSTGSLTSGFG
jgi:formylglycine-generating enzyme required for sulfatase activity